MNISFYTLGCKLNQAETDELKNKLIKLGHKAAPFDSGEDIAIIRACGVTCNASYTTREMIRRAKRKGAYVIATGCLENRDLEEIDWVGETNEEILSVIARSDDRSDEAIPWFGSASTADSENKRIASVAPQRTAGLPRNDTANALPNGDITNRTRAFIKIQTGCNFNCAYCIIPHFRGKSVSVPANTIIDQINETVKNGYNEAVLTAVNVCMYRDGKYDLADLLKTILLKTNIKRIRLGSLDPRLINDKMIDVYARQPKTPQRGVSARVLPHWNLSLQSGSDAVLKRMRRFYSAKKYLDIIKKIRKANPLFSFTTDIIVGFPGETEKEFNQTCDFVKKAGFAKVHVFPYSPRPGTMASKMKDQVQDKIKTQRVQKLIAIANITAKKFAKKFIGLTRPVLFEHPKNGYWLGYTPEYAQVRHRSDRNLHNKILNVKIKPEHLKIS